MACEATEEAVYQPPFIQSTGNNSDVRHDYSRIARERLNWWRDLVHIGMIFQKVNDMAGSR